MGPKIKTLAGWPFRHRVVSVLVLVILAIAGYFVYQQVSLWQNKHDFEQARAAIDSIYADIVSQVGQPDDFKIYNSCGVRHAEFSNGPISCNLNSDLIYDVKDEDSADVILGKVKKIISLNAKFMAIGKPANKITDAFVASSMYHTALSRYSSHHLNCVVNYIYDTPSEISLSIKDQAKKPFEITLGCYGLAKKAYYPLMNQ